MHGYDVTGSAFTNFCFRDKTMTAMASSFVLQRDNLFIASRDDKKLKKIESIPSPNLPRFDLEIDG